MLRGKCKGIDAGEGNAQIVGACSFSPVLRGWEAEQHPSPKVLVFHQAEPSLAHGRRLN